MARRVQQAPLRIDRDLLAATVGQMGIGLEDSQIARLADYGELLAKWNTVYNLTAIRSAEDIVRLHIADSLSLLPRYRGYAGPSGRSLDVGSGGGLPAIPLAVCCPGCQITAVDAVAKKVAFLTQAAVSLRLGNFHPMHCRIEQLRQEPFSVITSRAFAELGVFVDLTKDLLAPGGHWLAMKGQNPLQEIESLPDWVRVDAVERLSVPGLQAERHLVILSRN